MTEAWETNQLNGEAGPGTTTQQLDDDDHPKCCCGACGASCCKCFRLFMKYTVGRSLQLFLYVLDIATDIGVANADYKNGDTIFAYITLGLVFAPGFLFALFAFTEVLNNHTGILACFKAPLWLISFPLLPLWPIVRDLHQIYHGIMSLFPENRDYHLEYLNRPSRAYLVKFLEAFTEAAPQILLRLYKITLRRQELPFSQVETIEVVQVSFSLLSLASTVISTYQKNVTTSQIISGDMEDHKRFRMPFFVQILAFIWWTSFLVARFEVMALFAGALQWWIFVVIGIHVILMFLFQTVAANKNRVKRIFICLFSAFVFIFAYLEFNMKARLKVAPWFSYTVYSVLVFIENSVMLVVWYLTQQKATSDLPEADQEIYTTHRERLIFTHYGAFCFGLIMMILTFSCASKSPEDTDSKDEGQEMGIIRQS
ncbi:XK-related protein 6 isoform X2 [Panulirus ornatus]